MEIRFADPEFEAPYQAYLNYFEDLAGSIGGLFGWGESLVEGVQAGVRNHLTGHQILLRRLPARQEEALEKALRKSWGALRRTHREVEDPASYDEEANAWLPVQAYYSVFHGMLALAVATGGTVPRTHAGALRMAGDQVKRGSFPYPWSVSCEGCPQTGSPTFGGLRPTGETVHVLSSPDPETSEDRLAMFLRTTREKELERRFSEERRKAKPGRSRRNLNRSAKEGIAAGMALTTVFDIFWRLRKKASYDDADVFVLGAADELHARRFGQALVIVTDATVAALEALMGAYVGPKTMADLAEGYMKKTRSPEDSAMGRRSVSWSRQAHREGSRTA